MKQLLARLSGIMMLMIMTLTTFGSQIFAGHIFCPPTDGGGENGGAVPEIDATVAVTAIALLVGGLLLLSARNWKEEE